MDVNSKFGVKVIVKRSLKFDLEEFFTLTISFGADLKFSEKKPKNFTYEEVNLAEEFRENGEFVTNNLMSRISLLIAEITSSFGQQALILNPTVAKPND